MSPMPVEDSSVPLEDIDTMRLWIAQFLRRWLPLVTLIVGLSQTAPIWRDAGWQWGLGVSAGVVVLAWFTIGRLWWVLNGLVVREAEDDQRRRKYQASEDELRAYYAIVESQTSTKRAELNRVKSELRGAYMQLHVEQQQEWERKRQAAIDDLTEIQDGLDDT